VRAAAPLTVALAGALVALAGTPARAATIVIVNADAAGQGLNDPTPVVPAGGNTATTRGAAALAVFQRAASQWGSRLVSAVPIHVNTRFATLTCNATSALLASTGPTSLHRDFGGAPRAATWYAQALANALAGVDLDAADDEIVTEFNGGIGAPTCLAGTSWYLGFDGHPLAGQVDMLSVVLHELAHGFGFEPFDDLSTGAKFLGFDDAFLVDMFEQGVTPTALTDMTDAQRLAASTSDPNLYWGGASVQAVASTLSMGLTTGVAPGHVRLYGPSQSTPGSSQSHFSSALTPNELMEPSYTGPNHDLTMTADLLRDLGWKIQAATVPATPGAGLWLLALALAAAAGLRLRRGSSRCVPDPCGARRHSVADGGGPVEVRVTLEGR